MQAGVARTIYDELGVRPVINARGHNTFLGGSSLSPRVLAAMEEANRYFVDMADLLRRAGEIVSDLIGCEAAYVTSGAAGALALGTAACIAGENADAISRLPDVTGLRHEILIQRQHRYKYDRAPTIVGARLREVGDDRGTSAAQIEDAISDATAVILFPAHLDGRPGTVPLSEVVAIAKRHGVPLLVDAASQVYPLDRMKRFTQLGVDLFCFGSKYFGGPNSAGLLCGRRDLIASVALQSFIGFETTAHRSFGRPLKVDRQEVVAVVVALREWFSMDHEARIQRIDRRVRNLVDALGDTPGLVVAAEPSDGAAARVRLQFAPSSGKSSAEVDRALRDGNPSVWGFLDGDSLVLSMVTVRDGDERIIADRLRSVLTGA